MTSRILSRLNEDAAAVNTALEAMLTGRGTKYEVLRDAMRYSTLAGGKRIRPFLAIEFYRMFSGCLGTEKVMPFACAIELVHTYSLIHDDLPAMDNDELRRGKPTNHMVYGEATALLAGDALLTLAFEAVSDNGFISPESTIRAVKLLASGAGADGMIGGQQLDLIGETARYDMDTLREMQQLKTGKLIEAAAMLGLISAGFDPEREKAVKEYTSNVGLAFQITDDILNVTGDAKLLGKPVHSDDKNHKTTFMSYLDIKQAYELTKRLTDAACNALKNYNGNEYLTGLAYYLIDRNN